MDSEVKRLHLRAGALAAKLQQGGGTSCIDEAIELGREALELCPPGHPERRVSLNGLANHLISRYSQLGAMWDLDEAIVLFREAIELFQKGHSGRSMLSNNLASCLSMRYNQLGVLEDLDMAIVLCREALRFRPTGHPLRSTALNNLAAHLSTRYKLLGVMENLGEAIVLSQEALDLRPIGHPNRPSSLNSLASCLFSRYKRLGVMEDLDKAIVLGGEAPGLFPTGHPNQSMLLNNLASYLCTRYEQLGVMDDLDKTITLGRETLSVCPIGNLDRPMSLTNLASRLWTRYRRLGAMEDLVEAIVLARQALDLCQIGNPIRSASLTTLANCVSERFKQLRVVEDLNESIFLNREVLDLYPTGRPGRSAALDNLATCLSERHQKLKIMEDLNEAIVLSREALDLRPRGHPKRSFSLDHLAIQLSSRYQQLKVIRDLDEAIVLGREGLDLLPIGHPDQSMSLHNLAFHFFTRHKSLGAMKDLDEATVLGREAFDLCPQGHPDWSTMLSNLAKYLRHRFARSKQVQDQDELFSLYTQLVQVTQVVFSDDLSAAREWIQAAEEFQHPTILLAYETSLRLLVQQVAILPSLPQSLVVLKNLTSSLAVDAFSASLRNRSPTGAVELLEQGRGVFWSQLARLRSPLDDVIATGPAGKTLADDFTHLASLIRNTLGSPAADQHEQLCHLNLEMQSVVTRIRELPGLTRFLLPLPFTDLQRAAIGGPVIIVNACKYSCDVLVIVLDGDPVHIPLQITLESVRDLSKELHTLTVRAARANVTREFATFLRKLWDHIVSPIVDFLRTTYPPRSRIWWCPTGEFSALPLHAAAPYRKGQESLSDLYISSYTPTLTALIRARRDSPSTSVASQEKRFLAIGQAKAPGETELPSVGAELDIIGQGVSDFATFTRIDGEDSCASRVIEELGKNAWVHFACHGLPNRTQPLDSAFALHDGHFTVQQITGCDLKNPEFAYLSACHTTVGDGQSPDEVIHLASAMQFVGFRSVIGTMWAVDDGATTTITSTFYRYMVDETGRLDHTRAAFALNKTMKSVNIPFDQRILYIHLGA